MSQEFDNSPPAKFVKDRLRREKPDLSEEELELAWQQKLEAARRELGEGTCNACGG